MLIRAAVAAAVLAPALLSSCDAPQPAGGNDKTVVNREVCDQIHEAIDNATLDTVGSQAAIKLAGARSGVTERIRAAIDSYYRGDRAGGRQAMLTGCAAAGFPS